MYRRDFLTRLSQVMATASVATITASASTKGRYEKGRGHIDVDEVLRRVDRINARIDNDDLFDAPSQQVAERGFDSGLFRDSIKAMLVIGTFGDLNEQDQAHPAMQERLWASADLFDRTILGMATYLEGLSREERRRMHRVLKDNPNLLRAFQAGLDHDGREVRVPDPRLDHFHTLWNRSVRALSRPSYSTIIDEYVEKVDKVAKRCGISPELRRELALRWDGELVESLAFEADTGRNSFPDVTVEAGRSDLEPGKYTRKRIHRRAGFTLLGIGGGTWVLGGIMVLLSLKADLDGMLIGAIIAGTVGAILLIVALICAGIAASSPETDVVSGDGATTDPVYQQRVRQALDWVNKHRQLYQGKLEDLVAKAALEFEVRFNDVWTRLE